MRACPNDDGAVADWRAAENMPGAAMGADAKQSSRIGKVIKFIATAAVFTAVVVVMLLWLAGTFQPKIDAPRAEAEESPAGSSLPDDAKIVEARLLTVPRTESAAGTIRAVHQVSVAPKLLAKVVEVNVTAGANVEKGQVLVRLDDADLRARLGQAESSLRQAKAEQSQAQIDYDRLKRLIEQGAASQIEWDRAQTRLEAAEARVEQAREAVAEARTLLEYATIRSPIDGIVVDKRVEVGDTVSPGQELVSLYDPTRMQLVAQVRESLARKLEVGEPIGVHVSAIGKTCEGQISEIVPEAETASRTFAVKVTGPCPPGVYTGMFGRLQIPLGTEEVLVIPEEAIRRVGQLTLVDVTDGEVVYRRAVELGRRFVDGVEVLAGLHAGERVVVPRL